MAANGDDRDQLYSTAQAAKYLDVTEGHVRKLVSMGRLKAVPRQPDEPNQFRKRELDRYRAKRKRVGRPQGSISRQKMTPERREKWRLYMQKYRARKARKQSGKAKKASKKAGAKKGRR